MEPYLWIVWLVVFLVAVIIEATTLEIVSIFFAIGSVISLIISFIPGVEWWIQLIVFVVISGASLIGVRPLATKLLNKEKRSTNIDELIGKHVTIIDEDDDDLYETKVNGLIWRVMNIDENEKLAKNDKVEVISIKGNKLIVRKVEK